MIRLVILIIVALLGAGYYFGYFTKDDSVNDIITKSKGMADKKAQELKEKAQDKIKQIKEDAIDTTKEKIKNVEDKIKN